MSLLVIVILGIVEGVTEFLPVSSTAHLVLAAKFLGLPQSEFLKSFEIVIQLGAILAVVVLYGKELSASPRVLSRVLAAFLPTAIIGFLLYKAVKGIFLESENLILWLLFAGGLFLIVFELFYHEKEAAISRMEDISCGQAVIVGLFQSLAIVPGVSRSAATIIGGLCLGLKRKAIVEFSFILAVPTMLAASGWDLAKNSKSFSAGQFGLLLTGFLVSFAVALWGIKFLLVFVKNHNFIPFGVYRIILALLALRAFQH
ncbi:MAG: undecaprenyl-diphosphatase [Omnitrophica WOR_2 bacterium RIFCSPLOWO2_12_FULL_51_8]|nr:MAG: undecaprenyl-diphosphatase [Omnitrophica WOR_2 bacterium RIFCSPLOWO2_12_FULL_51_8]